MATMIEVLTVAFIRIMITNSGSSLCKKTSTCNNILSRLGFPVLGEALLITWCNHQTSKIRTSCYNPFTDQDIGGRKQYSLSMDQTYDYMFKLALIGDPGAGKSWVLSRFVDGTLERLSSPGIIMCFFNSSISHDFFAVDFRVRRIEVDGKKIKLQIWELDGRDRSKVPSSAPIHFLQAQIIHQSQVPTCSRRLLSPDHGVLDRLRRH